MRRRCPQQCAEQVLHPLQVYTNEGWATSEEQMVKNFMCALELINLVYEVGGPCVPGGWATSTGMSFLLQSRPTEYQELKMDVWVRALLIDR